jgi:CRISPR type III-A-associated RAMP protein Csm5
LRLLQLSDSQPVAPNQMRIELMQSLGTKRNTRTWIEAMQTGTELTTKLTLYDSHIVAEKMGFARLRERFQVESLLAACHRHSAEILDLEAEYFRGQQTLSVLLGQLKTMNQPQSPLLRIGGGQGFLNLTANLRLEYEDEELFEDAIRVGASNLPRRKWRTHENVFPKTRRVITDQQNKPTGLLGWVKLSVI